MLVFVDESGDPGMKRKLGSSDFFVVAAVIFIENTDAERCDEAITHLSQHCFGGRKQEFKFNQCCDDHRERFLKGIAEHEFLYLAFALNKKKIWGKGFAFKEPFYKYTCKLLFENASPYLSNATVVIDRSGNREFRKQLERYLKEKINTEGDKIRKVRTEDSRSNNLLQLADMISGAVYRSLRGDKKLPGKFRSYVRRRELGIQIWPSIY
jgi:hypothetical protein